jgi:hypothetical protein
MPAIVAMAAEPPAISTAAIRQVLRSAKAIGKQHHDCELTGLHADVEFGERERGLCRRQTEVLQRTRETEPVHESECERGDPPAARV